MVGVAFWNGCGFVKWVFFLFLVMLNPPLKNPDYATFAKVVAT